MKVAIVLGNRINDDGTFTKMMIKRLELAYELYSKKEIDKIIVSGGIANPNVKFSEAELMKKYLIKKGIEEDFIYEEKKSHTTRENAFFSVPMALELNPSEIIVVSSIEHFTKQNYNVIKYFAEAIGKRNIKLMIYTDCEDNDD